MPGLLGPPRSPSALEADFVMGEHRGEAHQRHCYLPILSVQEQVAAMHLERFALRHGERQRLCYDCSPT